MRYLIIFFGIFLASCSNVEDYSGEVLTDSIDYWVPIGNPVEQEYDDNWLDKGKRVEFLEDILSKARSGELPTYYYIPDTLMPMPKNELEYIFHHVDTEYFDTEEGYQAVPIEMNLDLDAIVRLKFREQWYWDSSSNKFFKKIIAICPMAERYKNINEVMGYAGLFWIYLP
jgi:hypothetical protein